MKRLVVFICALMFFAVAAAEADEGRAISVTVGGAKLSGVIYDTDLARQIAARFPLTVPMSGYIGREFYGIIDFRPQGASGGQRRFNDGDITYCAQNNSLAIFYAQTDRPNLTMDVIPIGKITSPLDVLHTLPSSVDVTFALAE